MSDTACAKMPGFLGYLAPVIVTSVAISNRRGDNLLRIGVVEGSELNRDVIAESRLEEAVMDAEVANCSASKHGPRQSVKFLAAREHIDNQLYALDLCL
jgi:hypothetical protein